MIFKAQYSEYYILSSDAAPKENQVQNVTSKLIYRTEFDIDFFKCSNQITMKYTLCLSNNRDTDMNEDAYDVIDHNQW